MKTYSGNLMENLENEKQKTVQILIAKLQENERLREKEFIKPKENEILKYILKNINKVKNLVKLDIIIHEYDLKELEFSPKKWIFLQENFYLTVLKLEVLCLSQRIKNLIGKSVVFIDSLKEISIKFDNSNIYYLYEDKPLVVDVYNVHLTEEFDNSIFINSRIKCKKLSFSIDYVATSDTKVNKRFLSFVYKKNYWNELKKSKFFPSIFSHELRKIMKFI